MTLTGHVKRKCKKKSKAHLLTKAGDKTGDKTACTLYPTCLRMGFVRCTFPPAIAEQFLERALSLGSHSSNGRARQGFTLKAAARASAALQQALQLGRGQV